MRITKEQKTIDFEAPLRGLVVNSKKYADQSSIPPKKFAKLDYVSNSYLSMLKRALNGEPQFYGGEGFLAFGAELHRRFLEPKERKVRLSAPEERLLAEMLKKLRSDRELMAYYNQCHLEQVDVPLLWGQHVKVTLDMKHKRKKSAKDLKTTSAVTQKEFEQSCFKYDYFRQGGIYSTPYGITDFEFVGISKKTLEIFKVNVLDYPREYRRGLDEGRALIETHQALRKTFKLPA